MSKNDYSQNSQNSSQNSQNKSQNCDRQGQKNRAENSSQNRSKNSSSDCHNKTAIKLSNGAEADRADAVLLRAASVPVLPSAEQERHPAIPIASRWAGCFLPVRFRTVCAVNAQTWRNRNPASAAVRAKFSVVVDAEVKTT